MEVEGLFSDTVELDQASFGEAPEALDSVDVVRSDGELILPMIDPEVLVESQIDQAIVPSPAVGMHDGIWTHFSANDGL